MKYLPAVIERTEVPSGSVALWWLGQAGFACKCDDGAVLYVDPYFSDVVEAVFGFKRISLAPVEAAQVRADGIISNHEHLDNLDAKLNMYLNKIKTDPDQAGDWTAYFAHLGTKIFKKDVMGVRK